jgi:sulfate transport system permease protein
MTGEDAVSFKRYSVVPGFHLAAGTTLLFLTLLVLVPVGALGLKASGLSRHDWIALVTDARVVASIRLSLVTSLFASVASMLLGLLLAWVITRYRFPLRSALDALIDLPFALPTAVAGIALTTLYAPHGWLGKPLSELGIAVAFTPVGITLALIFVGLPFAVRTVQPVIQRLDAALEESANVMGASAWQTFRYVLFPQMLPALLAGGALAFARGVGEYGSVVFISGNLPFKTEIAPLLIMTRLDQFDYVGATALAVVLLVISLVMMLLVNGLQQWSKRQTD